MSKTASYEPPSMDPVIPSPQLACTQAISISGGGAVMRALFGWICRRCYFPIADEPGGLCEACKKPRCAASSR